VTADSRQRGGDGESVLSRWSRRKLESRQPAAGTESPPGAEPSPPGDTASSAASTPAAAEEKPVLTDADMPNIDSLDENSDFSPFMSSGVSDQLRNVALRKLFRAPAFNICDGLDDYDDDYTSFEKLGDIITSDMKHHIELEQQRLREKLAEEQAAADEVETESAEPDAAGSDAEQQARLEAEPNGGRLASLDPAGDAEGTVKDEPYDEQ